MRAVKRMMGIGAVWTAMACVQSALAQTGSQALSPGAPLELQAVAQERLPLAGLWMGDGIALSEAGAGRLEALAARWRREFARVDRVRVVAHVLDPNDPAEHAAATQRAQQVQQALVSGGGRQWRYLTEVLPLNVSTLSGCGGMAAAKLAQDCPLAARAVVLEILGVRR